VGFHIISLNKVHPDGFRHICFDPQFLYGNSKEMVAHGLVRQAKV